MFSPLKALARIDFEFIEIFIYHTLLADIPYGTIHLVCVT